MDKIDKLDNEIQELLSTVTKEEYIQWLSSSCTKALILELAAERETIRDSWEEGDFTEESVDGTAQRSAQYLGRCQKITEVIELIRNLSKEETYDDNDSVGSQDISKA